MAGTTTYFVSMNERLRDFDERGDLRQRAARVLDLIGDAIPSMAQAARDSLVGRVQAPDRRAAAEAENVLAEYGRYFNILLSKLGEDEWATMADRLQRRARDYGLSARAIIGAHMNAFEVARSAILDLTDIEADERKSLLFALSRVAVIEAEVLSSALADEIASSEAEDRKRRQEKFDALIANQLDGATQLGNRLRDQARDASLATRGMLGKASEVAAAAEQSAIAMREAAMTSAGLIRAIEEARAEVDGSAEVAAKASIQAGEAVAMSAALSDHAHSIESILGLIRDIAGQTNLLALNATIEAARAGDAGRGFAVVAQEVKTLANQTARATDDIAQKIAAIQSATRLSVETNERIRATVEQVQELGLRIRNAMDSQAHTVTMITAAVDETALAADSMSSNISAIRQDTDVVASEIDSLEHGFGDVQEQLASLRDASRQFAGEAA